MAVSGNPDRLGIIRYARFVLTERPYAIQQALPNSVTIDEIELSGIVSNPPVGKKKVANIYWDPQTQELVFIIED
jgi:hypothetical protein